MPPRIRRPKDKEELFDRLTSKDERGPFGSTVDVMFFSAAIGAHFQREEEFEESMEPMVFELFQKSMEHEAFFDLIGIYHTDGVEILSDEREDAKVEIFERYANGGLDLIRERLASSSGDPFDVVMRLMAEAHSEREPGDDGLLEGML